MVDDTTEQLTPEQLTPRVIDSLYTEAMLLADEARSYFEDSARAARSSLDPLTRVGFSCESLKVTTRLMHVVAWLLTQRAAAAGEIAAAPRRSSARRLGRAADSDEVLVARFPQGAQDLIASSRDLYSRVKRLQDGAVLDPPPSPARALISRLERSL